jgi:hypothetical protein
MALPVERPRPRALALLEESVRLRREIGLPAAGVLALAAGRNCTVSQVHQAAVQVMNTAIATNWHVAAAQTKA